MSLVQAIVSAGLSEINDDASLVLRGSLWLR